MNISINIKNRPRLREMGIWCFGYLSYLLSELILSLLNLHRTWKTKVAAVRVACKIPLHDGGNIIDSLLSTPRSFPARTPRQISPPSWYLRFYLLLKGKENRSECTIMLVCKSYYPRRGVPIFSDFICASTIMHKLCVGGRGGEAIKRRCAGR